MKRPVLHRIYKIDYWIRSGTYPNATWMANELEVSKRTIQRDIEYMRDVLHAPIEYQTERRGFVYADNSYTLPALQLTEGEWLAIMLSLHWVQRLPASPLRTSVQQLLSKLPVMLPEKLSVDLNDMLEPISIASEPLRGDELLIIERVNFFRQAIENQQQVWMDYFTAGRREVNRRKLDPYHLRSADGAWYVIGFCHRSRERRTFALDRVQAVGVTGTRFERPDDFSIEDYLRYAWRHEVGDKVHDVAVRIEPTQVPWFAKKLWHHSQREEQCDDGSLILRFRVSGLHEMKRWVMQFGTGVEVLEPVELRELVSNEIAAMTKKYGVQ